MSDTNGENRMKDVVGGVPLDAHFYKDDLEKVIAETLSEPMSKYPPVMEVSQFSHNGSFTKLDERGAVVVRERINADRWKIVERLRRLGVDETDGELVCLPMDAQVDPRGVIVCRFALIWTPKEQETVAAPKLTVVP